MCSKMNSLEIEEFGTSVSRGKRAHYAELVELEFLIHFLFDFLWPERLVSLWRRITLCSGPVSIELRREEKIRRGF